MREDPQGGVLLEPIEEIQIDVAQAFVGDVVNALAERRAKLVELRPSGRDKVRALFHGPSRGLIGVNGELLTVTRGTAVMHRIFHGYAPFKASSRDGRPVCSSQLPKAGLSHTHCGTWRTGERCS